MAEPFSEPNLYARWLAEESAELQRAFGSDGGPAVAGEIIDLIRPITLLLMLPGIEGWMSAELQQRIDELDGSQTALSEFYATCNIALSLLAEVTKRNPDLQNRLMMEHRKKLLLRWEIT